MVVEEYDISNVTVERAAIKILKRDAESSIVHGTIYSVPRPGRHDGVIRYCAEDLHLPTPISGIQGFLLSSGVFVDRDKAAAIARLSGQPIILLSYQSTLDDVDYLYSVNVW